MQVHGVHIDERAALEREVLEHFFADFEDEHLIVGAFGNEVPGVLGEAAGLVLGYRAEMAIVMEELTSEYGDQEDVFCEACKAGALTARSEEHTSELQSLMRISYAVFCLKKKKQLYNIILI